MFRRVLFLLALLLIASPRALASDTPRALDELGAIPVQDGGRVMPLDSYARRVAVQLTGRQHWSKSGGPEAFADRRPIQLLCDLLFGGKGMLEKQLIGIENKPFKRAVGLDPERKFFTAAELVANRGISDQIMQFQRLREKDMNLQPKGDQRRALDLFEAAQTVASLGGGERLSMIPSAGGKAYRQAGLAGADVGCEAVRSAWMALGQAYSSGGSLDAPVKALREAIDAAGRPTEEDAKAVKLEFFYNRHDPWLKCAIYYGLSIVLFGLSALALRKPLTILAVVAALVGVGEHTLGVVLRSMILHRPPVSNTFEALLWMGLVGIAIAAIAQLVNRKSWYLVAGLGAALISVLFAGLVPLGDRTNSLPAVLRSNYWLTVHVLTIVASYGVLAVGAVLGHVYLAKQVLFARRGTAPPLSALSHPIIAQTYRTIQIGLFLLTAGTILGGVWAADSWGRFWGWDPKETWALISCLVYFAVLHARYIRWLRDFGLAAAAVLGFVVIVWTFYGVNYVMASGLHSYGFGSGGEIWVGLWAVLEIVFLIACRVRYSLMQRERAAPAPA